MSSVATVASASSVGAQGERSSTLTGTAALIRFILRRDRLRLPLWIGGISTLVYATASSTAALYPTQADLDAAAAPLLDNAAVIALNGPTYAIDTLGGQIVFQVGSFGYIVMALMAMFMVGRHTRADEEVGRTEMLRATVVGRNAPVTAALVTVSCAFVVLGVLIALCVLTEDVPSTGAIAYGAAMAAFGVFFASVMAVAAEVTEQNRTAYGITGALLGAVMTRSVPSVTSAAAACRGSHRWDGRSRCAPSRRSVGGLCCSWSEAQSCWWFWHMACSVCAISAPGWCRPSLDLQLARVGWGGLSDWRLGCSAATSPVGPSGSPSTGVAYGSIAKDVGDLIGDNAAVEDLIAQGAGDLTDTFLATATLTSALIAGGFLDRFDAAIAQ